MGPIGGEKRIKPVVFVQASVFDDCGLSLTEDYNDVTRISVIAGVKIPVPDGVTLPKDGTYIRVTAVTGDPCRYESGMETDIFNGTREYPGKLFKGWRLRRGHVRIEAEQDPETREITKILLKTGQRREQSGIFFTNTPS